MHELPLRRLIACLVAAVVVLSGLSVGVDYWLKPHWDAAQGAWVTPSGLAYWDDSTERWRATMNATYYWNEERGMWMYPNGVYWDDARSVWRDQFGDYIDAQLQVWVSATDDAYWDPVRHEWRPLVVSQ